MSAVWLEIDLAALRANYRALHGLLGGATQVMAVVKSDAYGHGMLPVASCLAEEGVTFFAVGRVAEGVLLRENGISGSIAVFLGAEKEELPDLFHYDLQPVVFDRNQLAQIGQAAVRAGRQIGVHLKVDTGMGRLGVQPSEVTEFVRLIGDAGGLYLAGLMSHPPLADTAERKYSTEQNRVFAEICERATFGGKTRAPAHIANSAALLQYPEMHWDMVRPGLSLYGCRPLEGGLAQRAELLPVMGFKTKVIQVKEVPAGFGVSYGHTFTTTRPSRLAVLPVGYSDGYLRVLSNRADVLIRGRRAPQRGRVCMNVTVVDVTDIPAVEPGDEVVLMGRQGEEVITPEEMADWMGTINYEVLCLFGKSNQRVYLSEH